MAETQEEAARVGCKYATSDLGCYDFGAHATEMTSLPDGWDDTCIPVGEDGDRTIAQIVAAGEAEPFRAACERRDKVRRKVDAMAVALAGEPLAGEVPTGGEETKP